MSRSLVATSFAVAMLVASPGARAQAASAKVAYTRAPSSAEVAAAQALLASDAQPEFRDARGQPISGVAFTAAAKAGQRYIAKPDTAHKTMILQLLPPGVDTPGSQTLTSTSHTTLSVTDHGRHYPATLHGINGRSITLQAFVAGAPRHQRYTVHIDKAAGTATLTLLPLGAAPPGSHPTADFAGIAQAPAPSVSQAVIPAPGSMFPAFTLPRLGRGTLDSARLKGHPYVVDFFFADCIGCIAELPELNAFHRQHPAWRVLAITFDDAKTAATFVQQRHFNWPVAYDGKAFDHRVGLQVYPTMVVVGADGKVLATRVGAQSGTSAASLQQWVADSVATAHATAARH